MIAIILVVIIAIGLFLRIYLPYDFVYGEFQRFYGVDAYKIMYIVDRISPYFPEYRVGANLWEYTISFIANVFALGKPTVQQLNNTAIWLTPIFSGFTMIATFFIGKILFNKWVGLIAAALLATFGGEYMARSLLGAVDYHCFEVFLTTMMILFIVLAVKKNRLFILGAGFFYGLYFITWGGALLFALIFNIWLFVEFVRKHVNNEDSTPVLAMGTEFYLVAMAVTLITRFNPFMYHALVFCLFFPVLLYLVSYVMRKVQPYYYPAAMVFALAVGTGLSYIFLPGLWNHFGNYFVYMFAWTDSTIGEELPLFITQSGQFTMSVMWFNFGIALILALIGAVAVHKKESYLLVWFAVILLTTLALRRFTYYLVVPTALLAGYVAYFLITFKLTVSHRVAMTAVLVCVLFFPNIVNAIRSTEPQNTYYSKDWYLSVKYLRDNMPFKDDLKVMSWADYGYWLKRDGRVEVVCTPAQGEDVKIAAEFFTCTDVDMANAILRDNLSPFIVIDSAMVTNKFNSIAIKANSPIRYQADGYKETMLYRLYYEELEGYRLYHQQGEVKILRNNAIVEEMHRIVFMKNMGLGTAMPLKSPFSPISCTIKGIVE